MAHILVSGLINLETSLKTDGFPVTYEPVRYPFHGVTSSVAGVGYNVAKAFKTLGHEVRLSSIIGQDAVADLVLSSLERDGIPDEFISRMPATAQSVILYDSSGARAIHTDLKDVQERLYPGARFETALDGCAAVIACNINFSRPLLKLANARGIPVISDLHALQDLTNPYDQDFLEAADVLFLSHERLQESPETIIQQIFERFRTRLIVVGLGARGALLAGRDGRVELVPAVNLRPVVSTVGAGDSLLSGFVHGFVMGLTPLAALERAVVFAAHKIGEVGGANGFLSADQLERAFDENRLRIQP